jgi:hypothetical protein
VLERDDEGFGEDDFVPSSRGYGSFVAHEKFTRVGVSVIFRRGCGSVVGRPLREL